MKLFLRATGPVLETARFPDVLVYAGSGEAWMGYGNATTPSILVPGQVYSFDVNVSPPTGGLWVPQGEPFGIKVVPVMHQNDAANVEILYGGEAASAATWTERRLETLAPASWEHGVDAGELRGSAYAGDAAPDSVRHRTLVTANATPLALLAWMNTTDHQGIPDLDLAVISEDGDVIASSGTPTPREMVRLGPANLQGAGNYTLVATSYGSARATFTVEWAVGLT